MSICVYVCWCVSVCLHLVEKYAAVAVTAYQRLLSSNKRSSKLTFLLCVTAFESTVYTNVNCASSDCRQEFHCFILLYILYSLIVHHRIVYHALFS